MLGWALSQLAWAHLKSVAILDGTSAAAHVGVPTTPSLAKALSQRIAVILTHARHAYASC
jgi:hypothetical protein